VWPPVSSELLGEADFSDPDAPSAACGAAVGTAAGIGSSSASLSASAAGACAGCCEGFCLAGLVSGAGTGSGSGSPTGSDWDSVEGSAAGEETELESVSLLGGATGCGAAVGLSEGSAADAVSPDEALSAPAEGGSMNSNAAGASDGSWVGSSVGPTVDFAVGLLDRLLLAEASSVVSQHQHQHQQVSQERETYQTGQDSAPQTSASDL
jgi:hypothetical protein